VVETELSLTLLPADLRVAPVHREAGPQADNLCGPYWISVALRAVGFLEATVEEAALVAGTRVPATGDPRSWLPIGEGPHGGSFPGLRRVDDPALAGTSIQGMLEAVEVLSGGSFRFLPIRGHAGRPFDREALARLIETILAEPEWGAIPLLNLRTGALWGARTPLVDALGYLAGDRVVPAPPEWDVGHFVNVAALLRGARGSLILLRDTYPSLGAGGIHLQPLELVAAALRRGDGHEGGCLLLVRSADAAEAERELKARGFDVGLWDNGTPYQREGGTR
jgi:hypothetical protein